MSTTLLVPATTHGRVIVDDVPAAGSLRLLVGFHGYAQSADDMMTELRTIVADGWVRVSVQALNRLYRGRSHDTVGNWMTRQDRERQIADNISYVDAAIDRVAAGREVSALAYCGFSQGVAMAFRAGLRGRRRADAVFALGGDVPPELLEDPRTLFPAVVLAGGTGDRFYTADQFAADTAALAARHADVRPVAFDGGHEWHDAFRSAAADVLRALPFGL